MEGPSLRFALGAILGGFASLAVSFWPIALIVMVALALLFGYAARSHAVVSGVLCGFGLTWLVLIGNSYRNCVAMGPDCGGSAGAVPFLIIAGLVFVAGLAVGLLGIVRDRAKRNGVNGSAT